MTEVSKFAFKAPEDLAAMSVAELEAEVARAGELRRLVRDYQLLAQTVLGAKVEAEAERRELARVSERLGKPVQVAAPQGVETGEAVSTPGAGG